MGVLFYQYYLLYKKILPNGNPPFSVVWIMSVLLSILINSPLNWTGNYLFYKELYAWIMIGSVGVIFWFLYRFYIENGKWRKIVLKRPKILNSGILSVIFAIVFTLFCFAVYLVGV